MAEGAVKKPKPNGVPKSPAQTCSSKLLAKKPTAGVSKASGVNKSPKSSASNKFEILKDGVEDTCKVCGEGFKRLMRHLRESASCGKEYGEFDQLAKEVSKAKHAARKAQGKFEKG